MNEKQWNIWKGILTTWNLDQRVNLKMLQIMKSKTYYLFNAWSPAYFTMKVIKAVVTIKVMSFFFFFLKILLQMSDTY